MSNAQLLEKHAPSNEDEGELIAANDPRFGIISINPERVSGTPCFAGTRVPVQDLWDYLGGGESLESFLDSFPTVSQEQAVQIIQMAAQKLMEGLPAR